MIVDIPDVGHVEFPDSMSDADVTAAIKTKILPQQANRGGYSSAPVTPIIGGAQPSVPMGPIFNKQLLPTDTMQPGVLRALAKQVTPANIGILGVAPAGVTAMGGSLLGKLGLAGLAGYFAGKGAEGAGQSLGQASAEQPGGQRREDITEAGISAVNMLPLLGVPRLGMKPVELPPKPPMVGTPEYLAYANEVSNRIRQQAEQSRSQTPPKPTPPVASSVSGHVTKQPAPLPVKPVQKPVVQTSPAASPFASVGKDIGLRYDGPTQFPGIEPRHSFTFSGLPKNDPAYGATFYMPEKSTPEQVLARAREVADNFRNINKQPPTKNASNDITETGKQGVESPVKGQEQKQSAPPTPSGPLQEAGLRGEGRGNAREDSGEGNEGRVLGAPKNAQLGRVGASGRVAIHLRKTPELLKDLGINPWIGKDVNNNTPFRKLDPHQLQDKFDEAQAAYKAAIKKEHPDKGGSPERAAELNAVWAELEKRFRAKGVESKAERPVQKPTKTGPESGFIIVPPTFWDKVGFQGSTKVDPAQLLSRVRNLLGETSDSFKFLQGAGLSNFLNQKRTPDELKHWVEQNSPQVEVRKFGAGSMSAEDKERAQLQHYFDTRGQDPHDPQPKSPWTPDEQQKRLRLMELDKKVGFTTINRSHWQTVAPKSEQDMPGYVEIAVVKPYNKAIEGDKFAMRTPSQDSGVQFPSSHDFPPNTLVFVRGYMETLPNGKKVFHVIEVQSDWAQRVREEKEAGGSRLQQTSNDPLLPHYERLALKAAIDHARSEGADAIAISDAETAMMTEGHDRMFTYYDETGRHEVEPPQPPGMRLHYDQILPKITGELTGEKGERVSFGEHKMAMTREGMEDDGRLVPRPDLIFRNSSDQPKTDVSARMFNIGKVNPENFTFFGKDKLPVQLSGRAGEAGFTINLPQAIIDKVRDAVKNGADDLRTWLDESGGPMGREFMNRLSGNALPRTSAINKEVGSKMYNYAQANAVSDVLAKVDPDLVLATKDPAFDKRLGATLVEYNLRDKGQTSVGKKWSPFQTDADYQAALRDPAIQDAINRHADIVLKDAEQRHEELGGSKIDLPDKRMFVNLKFVPQADIGGKLKGGNLKATLQGKTRFGQERTGTAEEYETSYKKIAERMIRANYAEYQRKLLNDSIVQQGLGEMVAPGDKIPENSVEIPVKLQRAVLLKEGESPSVINQSKSLYIDKRIAPEYLQAMQANSPMTLRGLRWLADVLTKVQVSLGVDAIQHSINMASAVEGVVRAQTGRNLVGVKEIDTISRITKNLVNVFTKDPTTQQLLRDMAKDYGIAREEHTYQGITGRTSHAGNAIRLVDQAGRMTLFQIAKELGDAGLMSKDPVEVRNFVNKHLGQYNQRLMSAFTAFAKSTFSPFIVAGKTFNRLGASRLILSPQVKAANPQAWATLRARQALYLGTALVVVPAVLNQAFNGNPFPEDTKIGEIKLTNGKILDVTRFMLLRRGERITGAQAIMEGQVMPRLRGEQPEALGQTAKEAFTDVARGVAAPYAGPLPNMASALLRGKTALNYPAAQSGETYPYWQAALRQANPMLGAGLTDQPRTGIEQRGQSMVGVRDSNPRAIVGRLRNQFLYKIGKANQPPSTPTQYQPLIDALQSNDMELAKKEYQALLQQHLSLHQFDKDPEREAKMDLQREFERYAKSHGNSSDDQEKAFVKTLTPHQQDLYQKALDEQKKVSDLFLQIQPKLPKKSRVAHFGF